MYRFLNDWLLPVAMGLCISGLIFSCAELVSADTTVELEINKLAYENPEQNKILTNPVPNAKLKLYWHDWYLFGSYEQNQVYYYGQQSYAIPVLGVGVGKRHQLTDHWSVFGDLGWYQPSMDAYNDDNEGQRYYMNGILLGTVSGQHLEKYTADKIGGAPGVTFGVKYMWHNVGVQVGYRWLVTEYNLYGESPSKGQVIGSPNGWWTMKHTHDLSGYFAGVTIGF